MKEERARTSGPAHGEGSILLRCAEVRKSFAGVRALQGVTMDVPMGRIVGLIGPNGAGKTTLFNCITGFLGIDAGAIEFHEERVDGRSPHYLARVGLVRTFQNIRMFRGMTVLESVLAGQYSRGRVGVISAALRLPAYRREWHEMNERAESVLTMLGLWAFRHRLADTLPLLLQRRVEVARALASTPTLLLLDEPTAGATQAEAAELLGILREINDRGLTILVIEHNMSFVMKLAELVYVLNFGAVIAAGSPDSVQGDKQVREAYLGSR